MKTYIKYPVIAFCTAMLAAGCSQGETVPAHEDGNDIRVPLVITTADIQTEETGTRASSELGMGTSIGVFLSNATGSSSYVPQNNVRYNHMGTGWRPATGGIYLKESDASLCAYTPYDASVKDAARVSLTPRILVENEMPLAYATDVIANEKNKEVRFSMKQACSWVVLSFKRNNIADDITLSGFSFINAGLYKVLTNGGMWFMNNTKGLFLPAAGFRDYVLGSGTAPTNNAGTYGYYWSSAANGSSYAYYLTFLSGNATVNYYRKPTGFSVRCVQGDKQ